MRINSIGECVHGQADATALLITLIRSPHKGLHTTGTTTESMDITGSFALSLWVSYYSLRYTIRDDDEP